MKSLKQLDDDFKKAKNIYDKFKKELPRECGKISVDETRKNIDNQTDVSGTKFTKRSELTQKIYNSRVSVKGSVFNAFNPILKQRGNLYRGIKYKVISSMKIFIGVNLNLVPYAEIHNEGGEIPITNKMRKFFYAMNMKAGISGKVKLNSLKSDASKCWWSLVKKNTPIIIPKRQYLGFNKKINNKITSFINKEVDKCFKFLK